MGSDSEYNKVLNKTESSEPRPSSGIVPKVATVYDKLNYILTRKYKKVAITGAPPITTIKEDLLFLGSFQDIDQAILKNRVQHVIYCGSIEPKIKIDSSVSLHVIKTSENKSYPIIIKHIRELITILESVSASKERAIIVCKSGINKSVVLSVAYCMMSYGEDLVHCIERIAKERSIIITNKSYLTQLVNLYRVMLKN